MYEGRLGLSTLAQMLEITLLFSVLAHLCLKLKTNADALRTWPDPLSYRIYKVVQVSLLSLRGISRTITYQDVLQLDCHGNSVGVSYFISNP